MVIRRLRALLWLAGSLAVFSSCVSSDQNPAEGEYIPRGQEEVVDGLDKDQEKNQEKDGSLIEEITDIIEHSLSEEEDGDAEKDLEPEDQLEEMSQEEILAMYQTYGVNEGGEIMVVMYHGIKDQPPYHRTASDFTKDLTFMYDHNYYLIGLHDYLNGYIDVPLGKTPIVLTFDDGLSSTFSLIEGEEGLVPDPESAIGLLEAFISEHPDFGRGGGLFIHSDITNFKGQGTMEDRLRWLIDHGYDLGNHTDDHKNLSKLEDAALVSSLGKVDQKVQELVPDYRLRVVSYPYGARPDEASIPLLTQGVYEGITLGYAYGLREGPSRPFYPPWHVRFEAYNMPRVRGSEGELQDLWWFFDNYEKYPMKRYVSDGNPETMVIPNGLKDQINQSFNQINFINY